MSAERCGSDTISLPVPDCEMEERHGSRNWFFKTSKGISTRPHVFFALLRSADRCSALTTGSGNTKNNCVRKPIQIQTHFPAKNTGFREFHPALGNYTFLTRSLAELEGGPHTHPIPLCEKAETRSRPSSVASELPNLRRTEFPQRWPAQPYTFRFGVSQTS